MTSLEPSTAVQTLSPKGRRTRDRLLAGARRAFGDSGSCVETRITDIAKESGVAYGSFYTYFDSKEQLFFELAAAVVNEMYEEGTSRYRGDDPTERIDAANRQFLASYRAHAVMMTIIEQAAAQYPDLRELRRELRGREDVATVGRDWRRRRIGLRHRNHLRSSRRRHSGDGRGGRRWRHVRVRLLVRRPARKLLG